MSKVLYFSKVNLVSDHLFKVYEDRNVLNKCLSFILSDIKDDVNYLDETYGIKDQDNENIIKETIEYKVKIRRKEDGIIDGLLRKNSRVYYKDLNEKDEIVRKSVPNIEIVRFYFDVYKEAIGFYTTKRLGYQEFNKALTGIINKAMKSNNRDIRFEVVLRTDGLNISEVYDQLKRIDKIGELKFKLQPPNPDTEFLDKIEKNGDSVVADMLNGNITGMSALFNSKGSQGLNLESDIIRENIEKVQALSELVGDKRAISRGYISIEAIGKNGKKYTTAEQKPVKTVITNDEEFIEACRSVIDALI